MKAKTSSRDIWLILIASFSFVACTTSAMPLIAGYSESLGASAALMGLIGGLMSFCSLFCRPFAGNLADKISKYKLSLAGAILMLLGNLGYIMAPNALVVAVSRVVHGTGYALCSVCMSTWLSNMLPREKLGSGMGLYGMANALANAIAPGMSVSIMNLFGYRVALSTALVYALIVLVIIQFVKNKGEPVHQTSAENTSGKQHLQVIDRKVLPVACVAMLISIPYFANQSFMVSYVEKLQIDVTVSLFFPTYAISLLLLRFCLKDFFDKVPFRIFITVCALSSSVGMVLLATLKNNVGLLLAAICMAGGYGLMCSICQSTALLLAGEGRRGIANSTYYAGMDLGMMIGPFIGGLLYGHLPIELFYPLLILPAPAGLALCWLNRTCRQGATEGPSAQQRDREGLS